MYLRKSLRKTRRSLTLSDTIGRMTHSKCPFTRSSHCSVLFPSRYNKIHLQIRTSLDTIEIHVSHYVSLMYLACILHVSSNLCRYMYLICIPKCISIHFFQRSVDTSAYVQPCFCHHLMCGYIMGYISLGLSERIPPPTPLGQSLSSKSGGRGGDSVRESWCESRKNTAPLPAFGSKWQLPKLRHTNQKST